MDNPNGVFKKKKVYFSQISNTALRDRNLSLKAKGLYSLIQSYITIEDFTLYKTTLMKNCMEGETAFQNAWNELKDAGYLLQIRHKNSKGTFVYEYDLLDVSENKPYPQKPPYGKVGILNNTDYNNTDNVDKNKTNRKRNPKRKPTKNNKSEYKDFALEAAASLADNQIKNNVI